MIILCFFFPAHNVVSILKTVVFIIFILCINGYALNFILLLTKKLIIINTVYENFTQSQDSLISIRSFYSNHFYWNIKRMCRINEYFTAVLRWVFITVYQTFSSILRCPIQFEPIYAILYKTFGYK